MNTIGAGASVAKPTDRDAAAREPMPALAELATEIKAADELLANGKPLASRQLSSITSRTDLRIAATAELTRADPERKGVATVIINKETARQWANLDAAEFARMRSEERKTVAMDAIAGNMRASPDYAEALEQRSPPLADAGKAINSEVQQQALARDAALAESRRLDELQTSRDARLAAIDARALGLVTTIRAQQIAEVTARLRHDPDDVLGKVDIREAQQGLSSSQNDALGEKNVSLLAGAERTLAEVEKLRVIKRPIQESELPQAIRSRFIVTQEKKGLLDQARTEFTYRSGNRQGELAFADDGKQLVTASDSRDTIVAMLEVAKTKNWKEVTISGSDVFRRQAWLEARMAGMEVRGFEPTEADRKLLLEVQKANGVENRIAVDGRNRADRTTDAAKRGGVHINTDELTANERAGLQQARAMLDAKGMSTEFTTAAIEQVENIARGQRIYVGTVVDHGPAKYRFDETKDQSYYITLETPAGQQTIWGKALQTAVAAGNVKKGEEIVLRNSGARNVTVKEKVLDGTGAVTGIRDKAARLNEWTAEPVARHAQQSLLNAAKAAPAREQAARPAPEPRRGDRER